MLKRFAALASLPALLAIAFTAVPTLAFAQAPAVSSSAIASLKPVAQANRIAAHPDFGPQTQLTGHLPAWVSQGVPVSSQAVDNSAPLHVSLVLQRDPVVQAAFEKLLADQQNPASPLYHQWLTPQQVGQLYGPTDADLAAVTSWLNAQGLVVDQVAKSRVLIDVHGSASAVANAFRTSFSYFNLNGTPRFSAASEPFIPTALTPVVKSIYGLTEVPLNPLSFVSAPHQPSASAKAASSSNGARPELTTGSATSGYSHFLTPGDFAIIYDVNSVYSGGNKGATLGSGTNHVAIIGRSRVSATDISEWAANTGISGYTLNTVIPTTGTDPGSVCTFANASTCTTSGDQGEQTLDVIRVIGTAPAANTDLVVSLSSKTTDGVYIAAAYNVNTLVDPVMTISYGSCETSNGASGVAVWDTLFSAGAAEGISTFVSSGDSGANGCASSFTATTTARSASINAICSSTYATCVGGTQFNDTANPSTYWSTTNTSADVSVLSYIPEGGWNEPEAGGTSTASDCSGGTYCPSGSGGGVSVYVSKPTWQTGTGVPTGTGRYVPDVAYPAASHDGYYSCLDFELGLYTSQGITSADNCTSAGGGYFFSFSGTSAAAPTMAGVAALLNSKAGKAQGNLNPTLYSLAAGTSGSSIFHDITVASSGVTTCDVTVPSMCNNSTPGKSANSTTATGGVQGYLVGTGYDEVTGLGSIDVANFLTAATATPLTATTTTVTATPSTITLGASSVLKATVVSASATGTVQFYVGASTLGTPVTLSGGTASYTYTPTTGGTYSITAVYSGDSTYATSTSATAATLTVTTGFALSAASTSLTTPVGVAKTDVITITSTAPFTGSIALTSSSTACNLSPTSVTLTSGGSATSTLTCTPTSTATLAEVVTGTTVSGSTTLTSTVTVNVTPTSPFSLSSSPATLNFTGGATGTTTQSTITVTPATGFTGTVNLTCLITPTGSTNPFYAPTCALSSQSVTGSGTSTLTISSHVTVQQASHSGPLTAGTATTWGLGALLLAMTGMLLPAGRRRPLRALRVLPVLALFGIAAAMVSGCGSGGNGNSITTPTTPIYNGSYGTYTVTVTGTSATYSSVSATTTVALTINQ